MVSLHVVIADHAGFHLRASDVRIPCNVRLLSLPAYCPELNPVEGFGRLLKAPTVNRLYRNLRRLGNHLIAITKSHCGSKEVASSVVVHCFRTRKNPQSPVVITVTSP